MSKEFKRENRYIVIKRSDLAKIPVPLQELLDAAVYQVKARIPARECVVVESDWPEYEPTWAAIERRVTGSVQWDARGLPPAGIYVYLAKDLDMLCMARGAAVTVPQGTKVYVSGLNTFENADEACVGISFGHSVGFAGANEIRPIPTPEQIEKQEAKIRVEDLARAIDEAGWKTPEILAAYLDSHGYRKQVAP